jgi:hypothetical protein
MPVLERAQFLAKYAPLESSIDPNDWLADLMNAPGIYENGIYVGDS